MPRKGENIYKRKDGRWEGRYIKSRTPAGKANYGYVYAKTYREVKAKLNDKGSVQISSATASPEVSSDLFEYVAIEWFNAISPQVKESTSNKYWNLLNSYAYNEYVKLDEYKKLTLADYIAPISFDPNSFIIVGPGGQLNFDWSKLIKDVFIKKPYVLPTLLNLVSPVTSLLYITSGIPFGNTPSVFDYSRTPSASRTADWLGYEFSEDNPGVTAWVGKASAEAQNEWGYAGVNAYLGKGEAEAKADAGIMKTTTKKEYKDGEWVEKSRTDFITAVAGTSAGVSVLAGDAEADVGSDMLGVEGKAEGSVGTAKAEAKGKFSVGEDGVNANVKGEAMVAAAEGEASGTINILGLEITGKVGGYAGAVGVEGKVGIEDNKFVLEGGAAALIGGSAGIEIGFNDEGWDNFVDFIVFWD